jgi:hypothetical protein
MAVLPKADQAGDLNGIHSKRAMDDWQRSRQPVWSACLEPRTLGFWSVLESALATKDSSKCRCWLPSKAAWDKLAPMINHQAVN